jgi:hypothetical protein
MSRDQRETRERRVARLLAGLVSQISTPPEQELRSMARNASSRSRPLPSPVRPRWPLQAGWTGALVVALVVAIGLGAGLGALIAPSGTAASGPIGTGFLPGPGWTVLQTGADATPQRQALAVATNVPLHPEDSARGIHNSSGLPYSTLLELPPGGVVVVALFTRRESEPWADVDFPKRDLPLRVLEALTSISYGYQIRPERPLGQYELRATVGSHHIVLHFYFGTSRPSPQLISAAQRQLDRLIVASTSAETATSPRRPTATVARAASRTIDRTVVCSVVQGNPREITVGAQPGTRLFGDRSKWKFRANASFSDSKAASPGTYAWITAGWPPDQQLGRPASAQSLSITTRCRATSSRVPLSSAGLSGGTVSPVGDRYDCVIAPKVLVRIRGVFRVPSSLRRGRAEELVARGPVREGYLAIRTLSGKPISLARIFESGKARLLVGSSCGRNG